jgi:hypothetical protein
VIRFTKLRIILFIRTGGASPLCYPKEASEGPIIPESVCRQIAGGGGAT